MRLRLYYALGLCSCLTSLAASDWTSLLDHGPGIGEHGGYPTFASGTELLESWVKKYPDILRSTSIGSSYEKRDIKAYVLTKKAKDGTATQKPQVLLTSLMHAREPTGLTVLLYFLGHMLELYANGDVEATYFLAAREIWLVPFVNPDGYVANEQLAKRGAIGVRKNRRPTGPCRKAQDGGVDINRNFAVHWSKTFPACDEEYQGTAPFSEPETQAVKKVCDDNHFQIAINYHSYGEMLTHPYNYARTELLPKEAQQIYREFSQVFGWRKFGPAIKTVGYTAIGESDDWMYGEKGIISMSPEVGPESGGFWPKADAIKGIDLQLFPRTAYGVKKAGLELAATVKLSSTGSQASLQLTLENRGLSPSLGDAIGVAIGDIADPGSVSASSSAGDVMGTAVGSQVLLRMPALLRRGAMTAAVSLSGASATSIPASLQLCVAEVLPNAEHICQCLRTQRNVLAEKSEFRKPSDGLCGAAVSALSSESYKPLPKTAEGTARPEVEPKALPQTSSPAAGNTEAVASATDAPMHTTTVANIIYVASSTVVFMEDDSSLYSATPLGPVAVSCISIAGVAGFALIAHFVYPFMFRKKQPAPAVGNVDPLESVGLQSQDADVEEGKNAND